MKEESTRELGFGSERLIEWDCHLLGDNWGWWTKIGCSALTHRA